MSTDSKVTILFLAANSNDTTWLRTDQEARAIDIALRKAEFRHFKIESQGAVRSDDLQELLQRHLPAILHFSGHGSEANEIILEDTNGKPMPVSANALRNLFRILKNNIRCVVLNACYSNEQAAALAEEIDCVIGMSDMITDEAARHFSTAFYSALGNGRSLLDAFRLGCNHIELQNLDEAYKPILHARNIDPATIYFIIPKV